MYQIKMYWPNIVIVIPTLMIVIGIYLLKNINNPFAKSKTTIIHGRYYNDISI